MVVLYITNSGFFKLAHLIFRWIPIFKLSKIVVKIQKNVRFECPCLRNELHIVIVALAIYQ